MDVSKTNILRIVKANHQMLGLGDGFEMSKLTECCFYHRYAWWADCTVCAKNDLYINSWLLYCNY